MQKYFVYCNLKKVIPELNQIWEIREIIVCNEYNKILNYLSSLFINNRTTTVHKSINQQRFKKTMI